MQSLPPEVRLRTFAGPSDLPGMLAVIEASKQADKIERNDSIESLTNYYAHLNNCDPYRDMVLAEVEGKLVGYSRAWWTLLHDGTRTYTSFGLLAPAWRRKGVGTAMLHRLQARMRAIAAEQPGDGPRFFEGFAEDSAVGSEALFLAEGYTPVRYSFEMVRPSLDAIPEATLPAGLAVRPVRPEHYRAIWEAADEAFRDHWGSWPASEADYQGWLNDPVIFTPELWQVAWDGEQVAGQVRSFISDGENVEYGRKRGYIDSISVRRPWRRRGLAEALILRSLKLLRERGMEEAALGVDAENLSGALRLYERSGFRVVKRSTLFRKPLD